MTPEQVEAIYAAFERSSGFEARTPDGRRDLIEPIAAAVLATIRDEFVALAPPASIARIAVWRLLGGDDDTHPWRDAE
jgi:hypothetical protein